MKTVKTKGAPMEVLYMDEARRVSSAATRLLGAANEGNKCAMLVECHTLLGQVRSLAESLEGELKYEGRIPKDEVRKEQGNG
ncbi:MAG: hypothetical protein IJN29_04745 [Akkermansia sp.]|nr:hypothetical protein [Akkermansia sp.]